MKKLLIFVLAVIMLLSAFPFAVFAADEDTEYEYHDEKVSTSGPFDYGKDWRDYKNYVLYEGNEEGYLISTVSVIVTEGFIAAGSVLDTSYFPKIEGRINRIVYTEYGEEREHTIYLDWEQLKDNGTWPVYTEEMIDEYISIVRYLSSFSFIETIYLSFSYIAYEHDPIEPDPSGDESTSEETSDIEKYDYKINPLCGGTWKEYEYYYYHPSYSPSHGEGYVTYELYVNVTDEYSPDDIVNDDSYFPAIRDRIKSMGSNGSDSLYISFYEEFEPGEDIVYTEEHIDEYISILRYICSFSFVTQVTPGRMHIFYPTPVDPDPSNTETTEPDLTKPADTKPETAETEVVTENGDNGENELNNPQTGDMFFVYLSVLLLSTGIAFVITAVIMKRKVNR